MHHSGECTLGRFKKEVTHPHMHWAHSYTQPTATHCTVLEHRGFGGITGVGCVRNVGRGDD
jgi:hypothetical protein